ncbi:acyltransferase family protein [Geodermatophilus sp. SYSU D00815]
MTTHLRPASARPARADRWPQLDLARAVVVAGLIPFHAALVFAADDDFYVKDDRTTDVLVPLAAPVVVWAMPLLFLIAGVGAWSSWRRRDGAGFVRRRWTRIGVPLLLGTVLLVPLPVWLRLRTDPGYTESYAEFWPRFFRVRVDWSEFPFLLQPAADGRGFETGHLWFLVLLLLYSLAAVPVLRFLSGDRGARLLGRLGAAAERRPGGVLLPAVLTGAACALIGLDEGIAASNEVVYGLFFAGGVLLAAAPGLRAAARRSVRPAVLVGVLALLAAGTLFLLRREVPGADPLLDRDLVSAVGRACFGVAGWCATLAIVGALAAPRPEPAAPGSRAAAYARSAVLPWYVLHQPVVVAVAFVVVGTSWPPVVTYLVIVAVSAAGTLLAHELLRRAGRGLARLSRREKAIRAR